MDLDPLVLYTVIVLAIGMAIPALVKQLLKSRAKRKAASRGGWVGALDR